MFSMNLSSTKKKGQKKTPSKSGKSTTKKPNSNSTAMKNTAFTPKADWNNYLTDNNYRLTPEDLLKKKSQMISRNNMFTNEGKAAITSTTTKKMPKSSSGSKSSYSNSKTPRSEDRFDYMMPRSDEELADLTVLDILFDNEDSDGNVNSGGNQSKLLRPEWSIHSISRDLDERLEFSDLEDYHLRTQHFAEHSIREGRAKQRAQRVSSSPIFSRSPAKSTSTERGTEQKERAKAVLTTSPINSSSRNKVPAPDRQYPSSSPERGEARAAVAGQSPRTPFRATAAAVGALSRSPAAKATTPTSNTAPARRSSPSPRKQSSSAAIAAGPSMRGASMGIGYGFAVGFGGLGDDRLQEAVQQSKLLLSEMKDLEGVSNQSKEFDAEKIESLLADFDTRIVTSSTIESKFEYSLELNARLLEVLSQTMTFLLHNEVELKNQKSEIDILSTKLSILSKGIPISARDISSAETYSSSQAIGSPTVPPSYSSFGTMAQVTSPLQQQYGEVNKTLHNNVVGVAAMEANQYDLLSQYQHQPPPPPIESLAQQQYLYQQQQQLQPAQPFHHDNARAVNTPRARALPLSTLTPTKEIFLGSSGNYTKPAVIGSQLLHRLTPN